MHFDLKLTYRYEVPDDDLMLLYGTSDPAGCAMAAVADPFAIVAFFPGTVLDCQVGPVTEHAPAPDGPMPKVLERNGPGQ